MGVLAANAATGGSSGSLDKVLAHGHAVKLQGRSGAADRGTTGALQRRKPKRQATSVPQRWTEGIVDRRRFAHGGRRYASYITYEGFTKKAEDTQSRKDGFMTTQKEAYIDLSHCKEALRPPDTVYTFRSAQDKLYAEDIEHLKMPVCNSEHRDSYLPYSAEEMSNALGASPALEEMERKKKEVARKCAQRRMAKQAAAVAAAHGVAPEMQRSLSAPSVTAVRSVPPISSFSEVTQLKPAAEVVHAATSSSFATARSLRHGNGASLEQGQSHDAVCPKCGSSSSARHPLEASRVIQAAQIRSDTFGARSQTSIQAQREDADHNNTTAAEPEDADQSVVLQVSLEPGSPLLSQRGLGSTSSRKVLDNNSCLSSRSSTSACGKSATKVKDVSEYLEDGNASHGSGHSSTSRAFRFLEQALVPDPNASTENAEVDRAATTKALRTLREALKASKSDAASVVSTTSGGGVLSMSTASAPSTLVAASERYQVALGAADEPSMSSNAVLEACLVQPQPAATKAPAGNAPAALKAKQSIGPTQPRRPASATAARANRRANSEVALPLRSVVYTPHKTTFKNNRPSSAQPQARPRSAP